MKQFTHYFFVSIILFSIFSRFFGISWGAPFFFHPDERNIASAITQLAFPKQMNPHFFAYGSLPLYSIYGFAVLTNTFNITTHTSINSVTFEQAIITGRIISALLSVALIFLLYILGEKIHSRNVGILSAFFGSTSIGLIQYAHFATFELWLTFFSFLLTYVSLLYYQHPSKRYIIFLSSIIGVLLSIKISSLFLFVPISILLWVKPNTQYYHWYKKIIFGMGNICFVFFIAAIIFVLTNPFAMVDTQSFLASIRYEVSVANGSLQVFYTQGFIQTIPVLYQLKFVYPFLLNCILVIFLIPAILYISWRTYIEKNKKYFISLIFFWTLFLSQATFFVKWTRYLIPTLPYIYTFIAVFLVDFWTKKHTGIKNIRIGTICTVGFFSLFISAFFVYQTYGKSDTRVVAYQWAKSHIPFNKHILSEVYDLGIVPFNESFPQITLFNFYDIDHDRSLQIQLQNDIQNTDYVILPSQRIFKSRLQNKKIFPQGYQFYTDLLAEKHYKKVYETPCDTICTLIYNFDPILHLEETAVVFDHPSIFIYKKI